MGENRHGPNCKWCNSDELCSCDDALAVVEQRIRDFRHKHCLNEPKAYEAISDLLTEFGFTVLP
jgi:hypothetical protein